MTTIVFIHGHGASKYSFNYIKASLASCCDELIDLEYNSDNGFYNNLAAMLKELEGVDDIVIVGHSKGGLYALHIANALKARVKAVVSMATPFGGSEAAILLNMIYPQQLYKDIYPYAAPIKDGKKMVLECPLTAIVTTKGHSQLMAAANDGIVTRDSMMDRQGARFIDVAATHHEIVMNPKTIEIINSVIENSILDVSHEGVFA